VLGKNTRIDKTVLNKKSKNKKQHGKYFTDERVSFWRVNKNHMRAFFYGLNSICWRQQQAESTESNMSYSQVVSSANHKT